MPDPQFLRARALGPAPLAGVGPGPPLAAASILQGPWSPEVRPGAGGAAPEGPSRAVAGAPSSSVLLRGAGAPYRGCPVSSQEGPGLAQVDGCRRGAGRMQGRQGASRTASPRLGSPASTLFCPFGAGTRGLPHQGQARGRSRLCPLKGVSGNVHSPWTPPGISLGGEMQGITRSDSGALQPVRGTGSRGLPDSRVPAPDPL